MIEILIYNLDVLAIPVIFSTATYIKANKWPKFSSTTKRFLRFSDGLLQYHILDNKEGLKLNPTEVWDNRSTLQLLGKWCSWKIFQLLLIIKFFVLNTSTYRYNIYISMNSPFQFLVRIFLRFFDVFSHFQSFWWLEREKWDILK